MIHEENNRLPAEQAAPTETVFADAVQHHQGGRLDEAAASYQCAIAIQPHNPSAFYNLGIVRLQQGRIEEAAASFESALGLMPNNPDANYNLGIARLQQERFAEAVGFFHRAIDLQPENRHAYTNMGISFYRLGRTDEAALCWRNAIFLAPSAPESYSNLGTALAKLRQPDEAIACYRTAIGLKPDFPDAYNNLGVTLRGEGRLDEAMACFRSAIAIQSDYPEGHLNLGMALLSRGEMASGWEEYEWRWRMPINAGHDRKYRQPRWRGEAAEGRTLLIHAEQGYGDTLQFCRYAKLASARGLRVIMHVQQPLVRLLRGLSGTDQVVDLSRELTTFDLECPMLSMPLATWTEGATIPSNLAYLHADEALVEFWRTRLSAIASPDLPRIGLVWEGNERHHSPIVTASDFLRTISPEQLAPLLEVSGVQFFSLQKDGSIAPKNFPLTDFMDEMEDFADTAALIANLDLVISVDTAVAHLAAGLGKPVWMLAPFVPCWRWFFDRRDSPWYPTLRLYRQPRPGDWDTVLAEVVQDLHGFARPRNPPGRFRHVDSIASSGSRHQSD